LFRVVPGNPGHSSLDNESFALQSRKETNLPQYAGGGIRERFTDVRTRVMIFLDYQVINARQRQIAA